MFKRCSKLSGEERRDSIIKAVTKVFAEKGFHGTTTKALAQAAGVSEALLFKHFPNKEALYLAIQQSCSSLLGSDGDDKIQELPPSTATLVLIVHTATSSTLVGCANSKGDARTHNQLMMRSVMEDGEFARMFLHNRLASWKTKVAECLEAAVAAGDAELGPLVPAIGAVFTTHLARMIMLTLMNETPLVDYGVSREELVEQTVWFVLRGMGLRNEAIERHYTSSKLSLRTA
jgi:AcrR family transcriptional regulator